MDARLPLHSEGEGNNIITDLNLDEGDQIEFEGVFDIELTDFALSEVQVDGETSLKLTVDADNSVTLVGYTLADVNELIGGNDNDNLFDFPIWDADDVFVKLNEPAFLLEPLIEGGFSSSLNANEAGTQAFLGVSYQNTPLEYIFNGTNLAPNEEFGAPLDFGPNSFIESFDLGDNTFGAASSNVLVGVDKVNLSGDDFVELLETAVNNDTVINASGTAFGATGRSVVISGSGDDDILAIDGATNWIYAGAGNDIINAGEDHDGLNIIVVGAGEDTVNITGSAADTAVVIETDGTNASGVVTIDGFRVGNNVEGEDFFVVEDSDGFELQFVGFAQGDLTSTSVLETALNSFSLSDFSDVGDEGIVLVQNGSEGAIASFDITENGGEIRDIHAQITNLSLTSDVDFQSTFYEFARYVEDVPTGPDVG